MSHYLTAMVANVLVGLIAALTLWAAGLGWLALIVTAAATLLWAAFGFFSANGFDYYGADSASASTRSDNNG